MRFLRRSSTTEADTAAEGTEAPGGDGSHVTHGHSPAKGKATPKRRDAEGKRRGPVAPPPRTTREAMKRNKQLRKRNPETKEERRASAKERRERMMAGDDRYLMPRDRGPVKAHVRDLVDAKRNLLGLFMPLAIVVFLALLVQHPLVQTYATLACTLFLAMMVVEGLLNGRRLARRARERFPDEHIQGLSIGWYGFIRASQLRKLRVPRPRVKPGDKV